MKKLYSTIMMLAMMVAELSFTACGDDDDDEVGGSHPSFLVGTWSFVYAEGWGMETDDEDVGGEYTQFKSNGKYINVQDDEGDIYISQGNWSVKGNEIIMKETQGDLKGTYTYTMIDRTQTTITVEMWGITVKLVKVPDSKIDKYLK